MDYETLSRTHDLSLPSWGPYSNCTFGLSHIHDHSEGSRVDFTLMPGFYRRPLAVPDARKPSGGLPWQCDASLRHYTYRQQLEWKDRLYAELRFDEVSQRCHRLRCTLVNNTDASRELAVQLLARLAPAAPKATLCPRALSVIPPRMAGNGLVADAMHAGEEASGEDILGGSVYSLPAGGNAEFDLTDAPAGEAYIYCRACRENAWRWEKLSRGSSTVIDYLAPEAMLINRLVIVPSGEVPALETALINTEIHVEAVAPGRYLLKFPGNGDAYGIFAARTPSFHRNYLVPDVMEAFAYRDYVLQKHPGDEIRLPGGAQGAFAIAIQPLLCHPGQRTDVDFFVWNGMENEVRRTLGEAEIPKDIADEYLEFPESPYRFGIERMASVVMTNVIYPIRCQGQFVRNHTPGRLWNSLYTWDSGFIGLGLLDLSTTRAIENLNAYLTPTGDSENAFVLHGTPMPMQIFLLFELWNRTCDMEMLRHFYPRCKQMYDYLAGHAKGSTTRSHCTAPLLCTWDYFYNSGGWDDYPPQWEYTLHPEKQRVIPVVTTAIAVRTAKLLKSLAALLDEPVSEYDTDITGFTRALQTFAWDEQAGYFGYVTVDEHKKPNGIFRHADGSNYNMGLDGTSPLIAGCTTAHQRQMLWEKLQSPKHLWCDAGLSTVDQSASYFTPDGYWNGSVWMPHQWLLWKAALNDGLDDFAEKIARTALALWERETRRTYACLEQFSVANGTGMGWHHFSGLSSPVLCWHHAYFAPGMLTAGYDVRIDRCQESSWNLTIAGSADEKTALILGGCPAGLTYNGQAVTLHRTFGNSVAFHLPKCTSGLLTVTP